MVTNWNKRFQQLIERSGASERDDGDYESVKSANGDGENLTSDGKSDPARVLPTDEGGEGSRELKRPLSSLFLRF